MLRSKRFPPQLNGPTTSVLLKSRLGCRVESYSDTALGAPSQHLSTTCSALSAPASQYSRLRFAIEKGSLENAPMSFSLWRGELVLRQTLFLLVWAIYRSSSLRSRWARFKSHGGPSVEQLLLYWHERVPSMCCFMMASSFFHNLGSNCLYCSTLSNVLLCACFLCRTSICSVCSGHSV